MAENMRMDILLKDMREQDARIEAEIQACAVLYRNVEKHTEYLGKRKEEKEIFERMLQSISGKSGVFYDSKAASDLTERVLAEEKAIAGNKRLIEEQKAYYVALRKKDVQALWGQEEEKSALAAICFAFEQGRETSYKLMVELVATRKNVLSETVARYFAEKALAYSESRQETDAVSEETDTLLRVIVDRTRFPQFGETWQGIEACLNMRKTRRALGRCDALLEAYGKAKERFATFETDYDNDCRRIRTEIQEWKKKTGRETAAAVKSTEEWFYHKKAELDLLVESRRGEVATIEEGSQVWQGIRAKLESWMESGREPDEAVCDNLKSLAGEKAEVVETEKLKQEKTRLLGTYDQYAEKMKAAEKADIKKAEADRKIAEEVEIEAARRRIRGEERAKAKRRERKERRVTFAKRLAVILVVLCNIVVFKVVYDSYNHDNVKNAQFYISLVHENYIRIESVKNENKDFLFFNPFGADLLEIHAPLKKVKIYNGTEEVFINCENLKELTIPDSVTSLRLYNVKDEFASTLELPKNLESLKIRKSPDLTDAGFRALKIPESVRSLNIGEDRCENLKNIDISNHLESLYVDTLDGSTVNVDGDVQTVDIEVLEGSSTTVNVNGDAQTVKINGGIDLFASFTVNVNGDVRELDTFDVGNLSVNGNGKIDILSRTMGNTDGNMELNLVPRVLNWRYTGEEGLTLPEGIEVLKLEYSGKNGLTLPEGIKILYLWENEPNDKSLKIPGSVRGLRIYSDTLDFDALKIPEGILYYKLSRGDDDREYQAENCPQELVDVMWSLANGHNGGDIDISGY